MKKNDYELEADYGESIELDKKTEEFLLKKSNAATCKIISESENGRPLHGTGFFCIIPYLGKVLLTNNHVLNKNSINEGEIIKCRYKYELKKFEIKNRKCYTNEDLDYTCIQILDEDKIEDFFEIENENSNNPKEYNYEDIAIPQYPKGGPLKINSGYLSEIINDYQIYHYVTTDYGSSGSPIILILRDFKILGIHCAKLQGKNRGITMKKIIDDIEKVKR
jgi:V8-like Glu-specific endopeptidase